MMDTETVIYILNGTLELNGTQRSTLPLGKKKEMKLCLWGTK